MARQLEGVQNRLAAAQQTETSVRDRLAATEAAQERLPTEDRSEYQVLALRAQLEQGQKLEQELRAQQATLSSAVAAEQSRWTDFNNRLDAIERSLPASAAR